MELGRSNLRVVVEMCMQLERQGLDSAEPNLLLACFRLTPGQILTLPGATPIKPRPELCKVRKGDTLSGIAARKLGDAGRWPEIARLNRDIVPDPDEILPGQVLVILKR
jgi:hypothetical protein